MPTGSDRSRLRVDDHHQRHRPRGLLGGVVWPVPTVCAGLRRGVEKHPDIVFAKVDTEAEQPRRGTGDVHPDAHGVPRGCPRLLQPGALPAAALQQVIDGVGTRHGRMSTPRWLGRRDPSASRGDSADDFVRSRPGSNVIDVRANPRRPAGHVPGHCSSRSAGCRSLDEVPAPRPSMSSAPPATAACARPTSCARTESRPTCRRWDARLAAGRPEPSSPVPMPRCRRPAPVSLGPRAHGVTVAMLCWSPEPGHKIP